MTSLKEKLKIWEKILREEEEKKKEEEENKKHITEAEQALEGLERLLEIVELGNTIELISNFRKLTITPHKDGLDHDDYYLEDRVQYHGDRLKVSGSKGEILGILSQQFIVDVYKFASSEKTEMCIESKNRPTIKIWPPIFEQ